MKNKFNSRKLTFGFIGALFVFSPLSLSSIDLETAAQEETEFFLEKYKEDSQ